MSVHNQAVGATDEWYTPPHVFRALACWFDLDVAAAPEWQQSHVPAGAYLRPPDADGLAAAWDGFVWMNPPFGARNGIVPWLARFIAHGDGIALTPDRTSGPWWQDAAAKADGLLFVAPKLQFIGADGKPGKSPGDGTTLMARGRQGVSALYRAQEAGLGLAVTPRWFT